MNLTLQANPAFKEIKQSDKRYIVMKGSAGSGKSVDTAQHYILRLMQDKGRNLLCVRKSDVTNRDSTFAELQGAIFRLFGDVYQKYWYINTLMQDKGRNLLCVRKSDVTNRDSTFAELQGAIFRLFGDVYQKYWYINTSNMLLECRSNHNQIIFRGVNDDKQREKLKSITFKRGKLTDVWIEEATELTQAFSDKSAEYVKNKDFSEAANEALRLYNLTMKVNRLELLKSACALELVNMGNEYQKYMGKVLTDEAEAEAKRQAGILGKTLDTTDIENAKKIVTGSWKNATFSERIWGNNASLKNNLDNLLTSGIIAGKHPTAALLPGSTPLLWPGTCASSLM